MGELSDPGELIDILGGKKRMNPGLGEKWVEVSEEALVGVTGNTEWEPVCRGILSLDTDLALGKVSWVQG